MSAKNGIAPEETKKKARRAATDLVDIDDLTRNIKSKAGESIKKKPSKGASSGADDGKTDANQSVAFAGKDGQLPDPVGNNADDDD